MTDAPALRHSPASEWEERLAVVWAAAEEPGALRERIHRLADELPDGSPIADFERASVADSTGEPESAAPLYRAALAAGLTGTRRRQATIQLASTLRNLGQPSEGLELLLAEHSHGSDELDDALAAFTALMLVDLDRSREATGLVLAALARHLPRYQRSVTSYAAALQDPTRD